MESFSYTALHFITSVCQLYLINEVSKGQRMWSINLWVGDYTRERKAGRIYHSLTWQDVLQLSLVELESFQPQLSSGTTSPRYTTVWMSAWACVACGRRYITILYVSTAIVLLCRWDSLLIVPACRTSVDTDGLYSPRALYECYKSSWIQGLWQRVMNEVYEGIFFSGLHDTVPREMLWMTDMNHFPPDWLGH